jgi:ligand-binding SRPBCC domain-containing protein
MPIIEIETPITSSIEVCFDLSRSIDLHMLSTASTNEKAIAGVAHGLINKGEFVTWRATHFGIRQEMTSKITAFERPAHFRDEQQQGPFRYLAHDHYFSVSGKTVIMKDIFKFQSPFGLIGKIFDKFVLVKYMRKLLVNRNAFIKYYSETGKWKAILNRNEY